MTTDLGAAALIDAALELAVLPSFSRVGPRVRGRLFAWEEPDADSLAGRTALVTGPTSGIGRAAARGLAKAGAHVVLVGRDAGRLAQVREELALLTDEDRYSMVVGDMSSLPSVESVVAHVAANEERLDVVVDNAGAIYQERADTADGIEQTLALLVCGPFALTRGLMPLLQASHGRVVAVTSGGMYTQAVDVDDI